MSDSESTPVIVTAAIRLLKPDGQGGYRLEEAERRMLEGLLARETSTEALTVASRELALFAQALHEERGQTEVARALIGVIGAVWTSRTGHEGKPAPGAPGEPVLPDAVRELLAGDKRYANLGQKAPEGAMKWWQVPGRKKDSEP